MPRDRRMDALRVALLLVAATTHGLWIASLAANADTPELERRDYIVLHRVGNAPPDAAIYDPTPGGFPFLHPPPVAALARVVAPLPPLALYAALLASSALALAAAMLGLRRMLSRGAPFDVVVLVALASAPWFLTVLLGQPIAVLVAAWALGAAWLRRRPFVAGLALALTALKPTFLVGPIVLVVVRREWRAAAGLAVGLVGLALASLAVGLERWPEWLAALARTAGTVAEADLPLEQHHTMLASLRAILPRARALELYAVIGSGLGAWTLVTVARRAADAPERSLAALALATVALVPYAYRYDALLLVIPAAITWRSPAYPESWRRALLGVAALTFALQHASVFELWPGAPLGLLTAVWLAMELLVRGSVPELRNLGSAVPADEVGDPAGLGAEPVDRSLLLTRAPEPAVDTTGAPRVG